MRRSAINVCTFSDQRYRQVRTQFWQDAHQRGRGRFVPPTNAECSYKAGSESPEDRPKVAMRPQNQSLGAAALNIGACSHGSVNCLRNVQPIVPSPYACPPLFMHTPTWTLAWHAL